jgi:hypothetical protein
VEVAVGEGVRLAVGEGVEVALGVLVAVAGLGVGKTASTVLGCCSTFIEAASVIVGRGVAEGVLVGIGVAVSTTTRVIGAGVLLAPFAAEDIGVNDT